MTSDYFQSFLNYTENIELCILLIYYYQLFLFIFADKFITII